MTDLDHPVYETGEEAAKAFDLKKPPLYVQIVEIKTSVDAIKSGVAKGSPDVVQYALRVMTPLRSQTSGR